MSNTEQNVFTTPYASRAGVIRAAKKAGFHLEDIKIDLRDGKHYLVSTCEIAPVAAPTTPPIATAKDPLKAGTSKRRVYDMMKANAVSVLFIAETLKIKTSAAQSLISDVKRAGIAVTMTKVEGKAHYRVA